MIFFIKRDFPLFNAVKKDNKNRNLFPPPALCRKILPGAFYYFTEKTGDSLKRKKGYLRIFEHSLHEAESRHVFK